MTGPQAAQIAASNAASVSAASALAPRKLVENVVIGPDGTRMTPRVQRRRKDLAPCAACLQTARSVATAVGIVEPAFTRVNPTLSVVDRPVNLVLEFHEGVPANGFPSLQIAATVLP